LFKSRLEALRAAVAAKRKAKGSDIFDDRPTDAGKGLKPALMGIGEWGQRSARDIDPDVTIATAHA
jgi:hypothetical protein